MLELQGEMITLELWLLLEAVKILELMGEH